MTQKISIIVLFSNQESKVTAIYTILTNVLQSFKEQYDYELIFVNDGSTDGSQNHIALLARGDSLFKAINLSRKFGYQKALCAGYDYASGDAIMTISADFVHDPSGLIIDMIQTWQQGAKVICVGAVKPLNECQTSPCRLLDKTVLQALAHCNKKDRYCIDTILWTVLATCMFFQMPILIKKRVCMVVCVIKLEYLQIY